LNNELTYAEKLEKKFINAIINEPNKPIKIKSKIGIRLKEDDSRKTEPEIEIKSTRPAYTKTASS